MNKIIKILLALLGGINAVFSILIPISLSLLLIKVMNLGEINMIITLIVGILASLFRAIKIGFIE